MKILSEKEYEIRMLVYNMNMERSECGEISNMGHCTESIDSIARTVKLFCGAFSLPVRVKMRHRPGSGFPRGVMKGGS